MTSSYYDVSPCKECYLEIFTFENNGVLEGVYRASTGQKQLGVFLDCSWFVYGLFLVLIGLSIPKLRINDSGHIAIRFMTFLKLFKMLTTNGPSYPFDPNPDPFKDHKQVHS